MRDRRQALGAGVKERPTASVDTRSLRAPGWLDKPGALRSLDVCLDSRVPFIEGFSRPLMPTATRCSAANCSLIVHCAGWRLHDLD
jgi:hypothetical protein